VLSYDQIQTEKESALRFRERRHDAWTTNYQLYRDRVITNRLTQRQSVNVPLMKATLKTLMAKFSKRTNLYFDELDNDKQKELFLNEYWRNFYDTNKIGVKERVDDLQQLLYGRSFEKLNIVDGKPHIEIIDPMDVLVDRYMDPADLDTATFITHTGIFRTLSQIERNPMYDKDALSRLKMMYATRAGLVKSEDNFGRLNDRNDRLRSMGDNSLYLPDLSETVIELNEIQRTEWNPSTKEDEQIVYVTADSEILMSKPLNSILNINFKTWTSWASDVERTDPWSDGEGDVVRVPNQTLNVWYSQLVENRTMRSFGMNYYDSSIDGFAPQTFTPAPFGWYPIPGNPNDLVKRIEVPDLSDSIDEMNYVTGLVESATAATAIEKGTGEDKQITLGEVQLLAAKAMDRVEGIADLRMQNRIEMGEKWAKLVMANSDKLDALKLWKKSAQGNVYSRTVKPTDWKSNAGYACRVVNQAEKDEEAMGGLQKMYAARQLFMNNPEFDRIIKEKSLDINGLTLEEKQRVMDADAQTMQMMQQAQAMMGQPGAAQPVA
jgi:hypothetical protein